MLSQPTHIKEHCADMIHTHVCIHTHTCTHTDCREDLQRMLSQSGVATYTCIHIHTHM